MDKFVSVPNIKAHPKAKASNIAKAQERLAGVETILSAATSALTVAAQFTDKDLSPLGKNLLTGVNVVSGISTGLALADWVRLHNEVLDLTL